MSKGNLLFGQARGKVGDLVLTRIAGEQVARARNRAPKNPRSVKQMVQRAALATLVEFFTRGQRNLFKFAFESKRPGESDYNAFVRANMGQVPVASRRTIKEDLFISGDFIITQGSLPSISLLLDDQNETGRIPVAPISMTGAAMTIGAVSKAFIEYYGLQDGDILTVVGISNPYVGAYISMEEATEAGALYGPGEPATWRILQFTLDTASTKLASTLGIFDLAGFTSGGSSLKLLGSITSDIGYENEAPFMLAVTVSRVVGSAVKVSTAELKLNQSAGLVNSLGKSNDWKTWVAKHYMESTTFDAKPEDILKGSISKN